MTDSPASVLLAPVPSSPTIAEARARVRTAGYEAECGPCGGAHWGLAVRDDAGRGFRVTIAPTGELEVPFDADDELRAAIAEARSAPMTIAVETYFGEQPIFDLHAQLRLLHAVAPDACVVIDACRFTTRLPKWLREAAEARTPPSPRALYTIHAVHDEGFVWVHTHGLQRCGAREVELLDVPMGQTDRIDALVHAVACMWMEHGVPDEGELFTPGKDMDVVWQSWERYLDGHDVHGPGGPDDRDDVHAAPSGVLRASVRSWTGRKLRCPSQLPGLRCDHPMLFISTMETDRQALLAAERLPRFVALHARLAGEARFLVKLGYPVDGATGPDDGREHLWFEVHGFDGDQVDATLLNSPYGVSALREGDRGLHALDKLSDWTILTPDGRFGPDEVFHLERLTH